MIENGVQSCLQVSSTSMCRDKVIQARFLRAKARFAANLRAAAHQGIQLQYLVVQRPSFLDNLGSRWSDIQAVLILDPNHREARELLPLPGGKMSTRIDHVSRLLPVRLSSNRPSKLHRVVRLGPHASRMKYGVRLRVSSRGGIFGPSFWSLMRYPQSQVGFFLGTFTCSSGQHSSIPGTRRVQQRSINGMRSAVPTS